MKGLSPFFSFAILIFFSFGLGIIVILFFTTFTKTSTSSVSGSGQSLISCSDSYPTVTLVRYPASGSGMMNVLFENPGHNNLTNIVIYTTMSNGVTYSNSSGYLSPLSSNSTQLFNINGLGTPTEVKVVGVCSRQAISGSCRFGASCMKGV
jgi:hypothetical protein